MSDQPNTSPIIAAGAALVANGMSLTAAAQALGSAGKELVDYSAIDPAGWARECRLAGERSARGFPASQGKATTATPLEVTLQTIKRVTALVAAGSTVKAAADSLRLDVRKLYKLRDRWKADWQAELTIAKAQLKAVGCETPSPAPCKRVRDGIRKATALAAAGLDRRQIAATLHTTPSADLLVAGPLPRSMETGIRPGNGGRDRPDSLASRKRPGSR